SHGFWTANNGLGHAGRFEQLVLDAATADKWQNHDLMAANLCSKVGQIGYDLDPVPAGQCLHGSRRLEAINGEASVGDFPAQRGPDMQAEPLQGLDIGSEIETPPEHAASR